MSARHGAPHRHHHRASAQPPPPAAYAAAFAADAPSAEVESLAFDSHDGAFDLATVTNWRLLRPPEYDPGADCPIMGTPFGEDAADPVVKLSCDCILNRSTVEQALTHKPQCPLCHFHYALPGAMPSGTMRVWREAQPCDGSEGHGSFVIAYSFPSGVQRRQHPEPGQPYSGTERTCYVPDTPRGRATLKLLKEAFRRGITFKIGTSVTTGRPNATTWAIHHKTSRAGGTQAYGYPDPTYDDRCAAECAALGLILDDDDEGTAEPPAKIAATQS
jgi:deltex-like protein